MKFQEDLSKIRDEQLLTNFSLVVQREREVISELIVHLAELEKRKLYAAEAYPSLFSYLTEKYHYSPGAAYRRIQATRLCQRFPEILRFLQEGKLNLTTIALIEPHIKNENDKSLIEKTIGKSQREVEDLLSEIRPKKVQFKDVIRTLPIRIRGNKENMMKEDPNRSDLFTRNEQEISRTGNEMQKNNLESSSVTSSAGSKNQKQEVRKVKIEFVADESLAQKIERAKEVLRHKCPRGKLEDIFNEALEALLEKKDPMRKIARAKMKRFFDPSGLRMTSQKKTPEAQTRYIPKEIRRAVWKRDQGQCSYKSPDGKRCGERGGIELDHVKPWSIGGESSIENVRLLCRSHNAWRVGFMK